MIVGLCYDILCHHYLNVHTNRSLQYTCGTILPNQFSSCSTTYLPPRPSCINGHIMPTVDCHPCNFSVQQSCSAHVEALHILHCCHTSNTNSLILFLILCNLRIHVSLTGWNEIPTSADDVNDQMQHSRCFVVDSHREMIGGVPEVTAKYKTLKFSRNV